MIRLLPPPLGLTVDVIGTSREIVDFAELFAFNRPKIASCLHISDVFPLWDEFMREFLVQAWPETAHVYFDWLQKTTNLVGADRNFSTLLDEFLRRVTFTETMYALKLPIYRFDAHLRPMYSERFFQGEDGFEVVGNVLWPRSALSIVWHITEAHFSTYKSCPRIYP